MLDRELAELYQVETRTLKQAVRRNIKRFPSDFMFELTYQELRNLRSQFVMSSWGGMRRPPMASTEMGVAMLSSVLKSDRAVQVNIQIMRAFTQLREMLASHKDLQRKILIITDLGETIVFINLRLDIFSQRFHAQVSEIATYIKQTGRLGMQKQ